MTIATTPANPSNSITATASRIVVARSARMMGTEVSVQVAVAPGERSAAEAAAATCMAWLAEVDQRLSRFRPESDLCRLNADAGRWHRCSDVLYACVERAVVAARASGGLFDPTLLPRLEALGYDRDFALIAHRETLSDSGGEPACGPMPAAGAWAAIELDPAGRRIRLPWGVRLDLGGIAKGWAADIAVERYCAGFDSTLVNVGGDLRLRGGPAPGQAWSAGIRDPLAEAGGAPGRDIAAVAFSRGGLATSGAAYRWWLRHGLRAHHLLDPRTGLPAAVWTGEDRTHGRSGEPLIATATALAPTAARAEVAAKLALLRGYPSALSAIEAAWESDGPLGTDSGADSGVALLLVLASGEVVVSANMRAYIESWGTAGAALPLLPGADGVSARFCDAPILE
ncbi:MAG TPA: FAD:protein FMN transferase [Ktedonobacterales bacterium]|jgi:thiamine biosynthesis lipoprotein|nr:FAD:protein FMN transferase [Ktedonobacterales bacterium]